MEDGYLTLGILGSEGCCQFSSLCGAASRNLEAQDWSRVRVRRRVQP
jgi:hypothetical protein